MSEQLFVHRHRPEWGRAIVASQGAGRRVYQFEDGRTRVIAHDYWDLMEPVEEGAEGLGKSLRRLRLLVKGTDSSMRSSPPPKASKDSGDQIEIFKSALADGFQEASYTSRYRGAEDRTRKSQIDPKIELAQEKLVEAEVPLPQGKDAKAWLDLVREVIFATDLLTASERKALQGVKGDGVEAVAITSWRLVYDDEHPFPERFEAWVDALEEAGARPTWGLATSLPALLDPQKHVCVRTSVFRAQASTIMPTLSVDPEADLAVYEALQKMVLDLRKRLEKEGLEPRDLFDVRNFIWLTLRKDAERKLGEMA
ncbi:MAG TPA: hypothetical protein RMH85_03780 [Polyangiaceae bacterium LLY-WYZ-15_(1-7)]|nr:hypothetical protein [Myxococcales bacterium]MAT28442.1 hypothetical protein [Sandaracinus sp.]HJK94790.1 hypothetical protein [Polyangiaceae bacterium LLY-WYZ-15_(1-7)]MBJ70409.1 hypothetical protein [Sandaracinus sp.]HJL03851.1 hypothetical protein [Polyangiaceae bacterium LLY-WYZ-15_(1-7)]